MFEKVIDHRRDKRRRLQLLIKWHGFAEEENTWEPISHIQRSTVISYFKRRRLPTPSDINDALEG